MSSASVGWHIPYADHFSSIGIFGKIGSRKGYNFTTSIKLSGILPTNSATAEFRIRFAKCAAINFA
ncbi:hypothetical protein COX60_01290 [Candidatus Berkelbacteria bacterium CG_4_10_14_0_2_um_filter_35_9_33_12]|uniref:Uncharacterized protein n=1 Tax=Candidatus Berkelbacteria bacterium CG_4_10_14_0_2_um_filter_35_9_33_12 TaxID=1974499 RepID=A0A2M7W493_9BACT|nr:MAG: hypothetical protein COX60_01290 [Candidatus Berkelbacteria bacterium CG_4_10_14_0_2_um_filter_35_9_33_12]